MDYPTVKVGDRENIVLKPPPSMAIRLDVINLGNTNIGRACFAALGVCWTGLGRPKTLYSMQGFDPAKYGGAVCDELVERGEPIADIYEAGTQAFMLLTESLPSLNMEAVEATADFTEGEADSTSR